MEILVNSWKRFVCVVSVFCLSFLSANSLADSTVSITIQGFVTTTCLATFENAGTGQNLNLTFDSTKLLIANGTLFCNDPTGFTVSLISKNGELKTRSTGLFLPNNLVGDASEVPYALEFKFPSTGATSEVVFISGKATSHITGLPGGTINDVFELSITYSGNTGLTSDTYSDQLTLSIGSP